MFVLSHNYELWSIEKQRNEKMGTNKNAGNISTGIGFESRLELILVGFVIRAFSQTIQLRAAV